MRSLKTKLLFAIAVICFVQAVLVAVLVREELAGQFSRFIYEQNLQDFITDVQGHYGLHGSLDRLAYEFEPGRFAGPNRGNREGRRAVPGHLEQGIRHGGRQHPRPKQGRGGLQRMASSREGRLQQHNFGVVDVEGIVRKGNRAYDLGEQVTVASLEDIMPIVVEEEIIGYVLPASTSVATLGSQEQAFLQANDRTLVYATVGALLVAVLGGAVCIRRYMEPLHGLITATQDMAKGNLKQQVPVRTKDEVGMLAQAFNRMSADLKRSNTLRLQMTADIAHDLRTPLSVITGYLEALKDGALPGSPERYAVMYNEAQHLTRLVEDLRTLSLADAGELRLAYTTIAPADLLEQLAGAFRHKAEKEGVTIQAKVTEDVPEFKADDMRLMQALGNIVSNALRFTPNGGTLTLSAYLEAQDVVLDIADSGAGISDEDLPHIFERFYRADGARHKQSGESGLGLAIVKSIVEAHGGTVEAKSDVGTGTTFTLRFPITPTD